MNTLEIQSLVNFLSQLVQARGIAKDPQADSLIVAAVAQQPDAAYLLVQRALLMEQALNSAKAQIASLQGQLQAAQSPPTRGFLDAEAWGNTPTLAARPAASTAIAPAPTQAAAMPAQAPGAAGFFSGGLGGTLGTVAATAAGVAGGAFLFHGIEQMMHGSGASGLMSHAGTASLAPPAQSTFINNYFAADPAVGTGATVDGLAADDPSWDDGSTSV